MNSNVEKRAEGTAKQQRISIVLGILLVAALVAAGVLMSKNKELSASQDDLTISLEELDLTKSDLENELVDLDASYQEQIAHNDSLTADVEAKVAEVKKLQGRLWTMKKKLEASQEENEQINQRLAQLDELRTALEADIVALQETNSELRAENHQLASDLQVTEEEVAILTAEVQEMSLKNQQLAARLFEIAPAGFVANNFAVSAKSRNEKLTARAKKAQEIKVTFDINDVPVEYQRDEEIYLVLTKFDGNPVEQVSTKDFTVKSASPIDIDAADVAQTALSERQSIEMSIDADRDLEPGLYNVLVYADHGFLGATTFELR